jgi:hypothetical protein
MCGFLIQIGGMEWMGLDAAPDGGPNEGLAHGLREGGAPKCSNYALSRIGMANTIFLVDLYPEPINLRYAVLERNKLVRLIRYA